MAEAEEEASTLQKKNMANFVWHKFVTIKFGKRETRRGKEMGGGGDVAPWGREQRWKHGKILGENNKQQHEQQ